VIVGAVHQLDVRLRTLTPAAVAFFAVLLDVLPGFGLGAFGLTPFSTLCVVCFWSLYRPDVFGAGTTFAIGIVYDALAGLPLGATALVLVLVRQVIVVQQRFFLAWSFAVVWCCFLLLAPAVEIARWAVLSLWWGHPFALQQLALSLLLTVALYPLVSLALTPVLRAIPRSSHAP
jgi:rod shape-determining protein MreD